MPKLGKDGIIRPEPDDTGYEYFNPDTGTEWAEDHPVRSGMVPDATGIRRMTYRRFREKSNSEEQ